MDRGVVVGQRFGGPAQGMVDETTVGVGLGEVGIESDRGVVVRPAAFAYTGSGHE